MTRRAKAARTEGPERLKPLLVPIAAVRGPRRGIGVAAVVAVELWMLAVAGIAAAIYESGVETYWCGVQQPRVDGLLVLACVITERAAGTFILIGVAGALAALVASVMTKLQTAY
ncbi:MAG: hypothetical protein JRN11_07545 [Nitrososphaerota archaeon]|nr:hypothetical protein [Nitrososphaerota archaeon]MDG7026585.1 hypothetical protein [Nitrososphaerota archaeon]